MKKLISICLAVLMLVTILAGCTPAEKPSEPSAPVADGSSVAVDNEPVNLTMWHSFTQEDRGAAVQKMADDFMAKNKNVTITLEVFPWATFDTKWKTGLSAGALPDLSTALPEGIMMMAESDALLPLNDMVEEMGNPFLEKPFESLSFNGNKLAVPFYAHARALWYRKDVLEKYSLDVPSNLAELLEATKTITAKSNGEMYGMAVPMSKKDFYGTIYLYIVSKAMGGNVLTSEGKADLTSPVMIEAINYLVDMYKNASPEGSISYGDPETNDSFIQGKAAFYFESGFAINRVITGNPEIADKFGAIAPPPAKDGGESGWFADYISLVVWKNSKNPEYAQKFIQSMFEEENYVNFLHLVPGGMLPTIKSIYDSEEFWNNDIIKAHKDDVEVIKEGISKGCPVANDFGPNPATNIIKSQGIIEEMLQNIVLGTMTVEAAAKNAEDTINAEIAKLG